MRSLPLLLACLPVLVAGCAGSDTTGPGFVPRIVVHAVLDPQNDEQVILVERTTDAPASSAVATDASDPIRSSGGVPVSGARVVILGPDADSAIAVEDHAARAGRDGTGVYRIASRNDAGATAGVLHLVPGGRYRLRVETALGTVHGETVLPRFPASIDRRTRRFNLDADTLDRPELGRGPAPAAYLMRHVVPGVVNRERLDPSGRRILLRPAPMSDDATWSFAFSRHDIHPGMPQRFVVVAVDSNYWAYLASGADPFGHDARGNRLVGGVGLFGAVATVVDASLALEAALDHPIEGDWAGGADVPGLPISFGLFESPRFPGPGGGTGLHLWGTARMPGGISMLAEASLTGQSLDVQLTVPGQATVRRVAGTFDGGTLTLSVPGTTLTVRYQPAAAAVTR